MTNKKKLIALRSSIFFCFLFPAVAEAQVFVRPDAQGANNGTSWTNAYTSLDSALSKTAAGEIWVAAGTYKPTVNFTYHSYPAFHLNKKIALYGGFTGSETSLGQRNVSSNPTILSGDVGVAGYELDNTPTVIAITGSNIDSNTVVDGFTVTKGYYTSASGSDYGNAAVYIFTDIYNNGSPVIRNCTIKENFGFSGAGIYVRSAKPLLFNNLIANNTAYQGAGIYLDYSGNARVIGNRIINNRCVGGYTHLSGGGIQIQAYCAPYIYGNLIDNNQTGTYGGGIAVESNYSAVIANNIISNNTSGTGGGLYIDFTTTHLLNNLIIGNKATGNGGGLYVNYSFASRSVNNTIAGNASDNYGGGVYLYDGNMQFTNTVIYKNQTKYGKQFASTNPNRTDWFPRLDYCDLEEGRQGISFSNPAKLDSIWRTGNLLAYPNFVDTANSNYRLLPQSVCIDAGQPDTTGLLLPLSDAGGATRFRGTRIDIGCYEYDSSAVGSGNLIVSPTIVNVEGRADSTFNLTVSANPGWSVVSTSDWLAVGSQVGSNPTTLPITAKANPSLTAPRTGKIIFSRPVIEPTVAVKISQSGSAYLTASPDTLYIGSHVNDTASFAVFSNVSWYLTNYPGWISFNKYGSSGNATVTAKATTANLSGANKLGSVNIYSNQYNLNPAILRRIVAVQLPGYFLLCQNGSDSISALVSGPAYQWQVDTGSGYVNLADNLYYSGTTGKWLTFTGIPSFFNGYKYRCVVGGFFSEVYALKIQNTWTGTVNSQWENTANWSCGQLPDANTDVVISQGNVLVSSNATIRSLTIASGATLTVATGFQLTVLK